MSKSNQNCSVFNCSSVRRNNTNLSFHLFPKENQKIRVVTDFGNNELVDRRKLWAIKLRMGKKISNCMVVCSRHFTENDYECSGWSGQKRLKPTAIPSQNLPSSNADTQLLKLKQKQKLANARASLQKKRETVSKSPSNTVVKEMTTEDNAVEGLLMLGSCSTFYDGNTVSKTVSVQTDSPVEYRDCAVQVNSEELKCSGTYFKDSAVQVDTRKMMTICDFVQTEKELSSTTGINSFSLLYTLVELLGRFITDKRIHRLTVFERVFLTFMKLKLNLPYVILAVLFRVSSQTCKNIFFETVVALVPILETVITFPSKEEIKHNMPKCFKQFSKVRIVLDCTEVPVQRHKNLCCRVKCYSHYKGTMTLKFMTGVTPAGLISYISPAYGGRTSDKAIFERSGLLDKLDMYIDEIMVDKGFLIENMCEDYGIRIVRPPFLRKKTQFSQAEAILTRQIASARVHIERVNQRIKVFKILTNQLPVNLVPIADHIFLIVCAIVNLSNPILADDKFLS